MRFLLKRPRLVLLVLVSAAAVVAWGLLRPPADLRAFAAIRSGWVDGDEATGARRCLDVSDKYPGTTGGIAALMLAAIHAGDLPEGVEAKRRLAGEVAEAEIGRIAGALDRMQGGLEVIADLGPAFLARARAEPGHPLAGRLAAAVCVMTRPDTDGTPPRLYVEAADLIADRLAGGGGLGHFCEGLGTHAGSPPWAGAFERHVRAILAANQDRRIRCAAMFALASIVQSADEGRGGEAEELFTRFRAEFDGSVSYPYQTLEKELNKLAEGQIAELRHRAAGLPAPDIEGVGLEGEALSLRGQRGRAVLLTFWATWCFPCMKLVPHEREVAEKLAGKPFTILGVNCDTDLDKARGAVKRAGMLWRSFRNKGGGEAITARWKILGYPTLYLIDHHGVIRKRWIGAPPGGEMGRLAGILADAAVNKVPAGKIAGLLTAAPAAGKAEVKEEARPGGVFIDKVLADGSKYVVFVPRGHDGGRPVPAVLSLHGSGSRGEDGRGAVRHGLAKVIRERGGDFPFLVVFPQARGGENFLAGTPGGRRALAALEAAGKEYRIDAARVALTGVSMGGEGVWSLAAAEPGRWSCIVPVCHGGDTGTAGRLVKVPCWCFHGEADRMIPARQSRAMVRAVIEAGGRPLYQEFPGVGHDDCADRAYGMADLWEWVLQQRAG